MVSFSLHSLCRAYGWQFIWNVALPHPLKLLKAWIVVRKLVFGEGFVDVPDVDGADVNPANSRSLVGVGFCLKPMTCPSGRFNHACACPAGADSGAIRDCCRACEIRIWREHALRAGSAFYIMTSARDILYDVFLPALRERRFVTGRFLICRFSFKPFALGMLVSGIRGRLVAFQNGDCRDFRTWAQADVGIKDERTTLPESAETLLGIENSHWDGIGKTPS